MRLLQLIQLYFYVCEIYEQELQWHCMRHTKNQAEPKFTDSEPLSSYLFSLAYERKTRVKDAYEYIKTIGLTVFQTFQVIKRIMPALTAWLVLCLIWQLI